MQALYEHGPDAKQYISSVSMTRAFCVTKSPIPHCCRAVISCTRSIQCCSVCIVTVNNIIHVYLALGDSTAIPSSSSEPEVYNHVYFMVIGPT